MKTQLRSEFNMCLWQRDLPLSVNPQLILRPRSMKKYCNMPVSFRMVCYIMWWWLILFLCYIFNFSIYLTFYYGEIKIYVKLEYRTPMYLLPSPDLLSTPGWYCAIHSSQTSPVLSWRKLKMLHSFSILAFISENILASVSKHEVFF